MSSIRSTVASGVSRIAKANQTQKPSGIHMRFAENSLWRNVIMPVKNPSPTHRAPALFLYFQALEPDILSGVDRLKKGVGLLGDRV